MYTTYTYQDWLATAEAERPSLLLKIIESYKASDDFQHALVANDYFRADNREVGKKTVLRAMSVQTTDASGRTRKRAESKEVVGNRIRSAFFFRFVTQQNQFLLSNGVTLEEDSYKNALGADFDKTLERMGLPFYFTSGAGAVRYAEGTVLDELSDAELEALLSSGSLLVDGDSADILAERGFASAMGVEPRHWDLGPRAAETYDGTDSMCSTAQKYKRRLVPTDPMLEVLSYNCRNNDGELELLAPAVTLLPRKEGGAVGVFCGTANAPFTYGEGFAFLNESRKRQLVSILARLGGLPMYCVGDDEVCLRVSEVDDGRLFAAIYLLGVDPIEEPRIYLEKPATEITYLDPDGNEQPLAFTAEEDGIYRLDARIEALYPHFLFIK